MVGYVNVSDMIKTTDGVIIGENTMFLTNNQVKSWMIKIKDGEI